MDLFRIFRETRRIDPKADYRRAYGPFGRTRERDRGIARTDLGTRGTPCKVRDPQEQPQQSVPPSKDGNRPKKNQSLWERSGKKVGGQPGHKGSTLEMTDSPDTVVDHVPDFCRRCGNGISGILAELAAKRQVVDIPPVVPHYTEHPTLRRECPCGNVCEGSFPDNVRAPISYGPNVQAAVAHTRQYLPVGRTAELLGDFCGLPISHGTIINILKGFTAKSAPAYGLIAQKARGAKVPLPF